MVLLFDVLDMCSDAGMLQLRVLDAEDYHVLFRGVGDEVPPRLLYARVESFDPPSPTGIMTVNAHPLPTRARKATP